MELFTQLLGFVIAIGIVGLGFSAIVQQAAGMRRFANWYFGGILRMTGRAIGGLLRWIASWFDGR